jgi:hypothetical protein
MEKFFHGFDDKIDKTREKVHANYQEHVNLVETHFTESLSSHEAGMNAKREQLLNSKRRLESEAMNETNHVRDSALTKGFSSKRLSNEHNLDYKSTSLDDAISRCNGIKLKHLRYRFMTNKNITPDILLRSYMFDNHFDIVKDIKYSHINSIQKIQHINLPKGDRPYWQNEAYLALPLGRFLIRTQNKRNDQKLTMFNSNGEPVNTIEFKFKNNTKLSCSSKFIFIMSWRKEILEHVAVFDYKLNLIFSIGIDDWFKALVVNNKFRIAYVDNQNTINIMDSVYHGFITFRFNNSAVAFHKKEKNKSFQFRNEMTLINFNNKFFFFQSRKKDYIFLILRANGLISNSIIVVQPDLNINFTFFDKYFNYYESSPAGRLIVLNSKRLNRRLVNTTDFTYDYSMYKYHLRGIYIAHTNVQEEIILTYFESA